MTRARARDSEWARESDSRWFFDTKKFLEQCFDTDWASVEVLAARVPCFVLAGQVKRDLPCNSYLGWLVGWLVGVCDGWLVGGLVGWLVGSDI